MLLVDKSAAFNNAGEKSITIYLGRIKWPLAVAIHHRTIENQLLIDSGMIC